MGEETFSPAPTSSFALLDAAEFLNERKERGRGGRKEIIWRTITAMKYRYSLEVVLPGSRAGREEGKEEGKRKAHRLPQSRYLTWV